MKKMRVFAAACGAVLACAFAPAAASAQGMMPTGAEIIGHSVQVQTQTGTINTIYFEPGGVARIVSPSGTEVQGTWSVANGSLCLGAGTARECFPYQNAFQTGRAVNLTSDCGAASVWTPVSTAPMSPPVTRGERG